jgi:protein-tyrosine phosphatase
MNKYCVLFVCADNLCRSPTAAAVMRHKVIDLGWEDRVAVDSAGTHDFNVGEPVDIRVQKHAQRRGYELAGLKARLLQPDDFERFDLILAMDEVNMLFLKELCPPGLQDRVHYFTEFCSTQDSLDVPDPFFGKTQDFEHVLDMVEDGCEGLIAHLQKTRP